MRRGPSFVLERFGKAQRGGPVGEAPDLSDGTDRGGRTGMRTETLFSGKQHLPLPACRRPRPRHPHRMPTTSRRA